MIPHGKHYYHITVVVINESYNILKVNLLTNIRYYFKNRVYGKTRSYCTRRAVTLFEKRMFIKMKRVNKKSIAVEME